MSIQFLLLRCPFPPVAHLVTTPRPGRVALVLSPATRVQHAKVHRSPQCLSDVSGEGVQRVTGFLQYTGLAAPQPLDI